MMTWRETLRAASWLVWKDLRCEWRARRVAPAMLLLGGLLVVMVALQLDLPAPLRRSVGGGLSWLTIFLAGTLALERSWSAEREEGCYDALRLYPIPRSAIYLAKLLVNLIAITLLEAVVVPALVVLADIPLFARPGPLLLVAMLSNLGFAAVGTVLSAATSGLAQRGGLLAILSLPLLAPVILAATEATRSLLAEPADDGWLRPVQLLACFALLFSTLGALVFDIVLED
ncbi:MAG: heme exporter protein CcmB [Pirellulales bacterium]